MARVVSVKGAAVVLRTVDKRESYLYRGAVVPADGFTEQGLAHAEGLGLIELAEVEDAQAEAGDGDDSGDQGQGGSSASAGSDGDVQLPEGEPTKSWHHNQIDLWASRQEPPITFDADLSIAKKLDAIAAAKKS